MASNGNNNSSAKLCGGEGETLTVGPATPGLSTTASAGVVVGGLVHDTAHLTGGANPQGSIEFNLYPSSDEDCSGDPLLPPTQVMAPFTQWL